MDFAKLIQSEGTVDWAKDLVAYLSPYPYVADMVFLFLALATGAIMSVLLYYFMARVVVRFYDRYCEMSPSLMRCIRRMVSALAPAIPIYLVAYCIWVDGIHEWIAVVTRTLMECLLVIVIARALIYGILSVGVWYKQQRNAEQRPIDGLLDVAITFVWLAAIIIIVSIVLDKSPIYLLSGLGAIAAVLALLFQQTILSFVASVHVNADHLVEIGDWISMENGDIDGSVEEISLHTVKVRNWDQTLVCMPICNLVNKPFTNYTAMQRMGGRRIKVAFLIDQRSIRFLNKEEVNELKGIDILKEYLDGMEEKIEAYNNSRTHFNALYLTNLGTFRMYAKRYLERSPLIRTDMSLVVRELPPTSTGIPLELYCFSKDVNWEPHEKVKSDIIEHLLAIMPNFRLRVFQSCSDLYQNSENMIDMVGGAYHAVRHPRRKSASAASAATSAVSAAPVPPLRGEG